ncbi:hypothetical protein R6Q59_006730 [Mikania micrantha]
MFGTLGRSEIKIRHIIPSLEFHFNHRVKSLDQSRITVTICSMTRFVLSLKAFCPYYEMSKHFQSSASSLLSSSSSSFSSSSTLPFSPFNHKFWVFKSKSVPIFFIFSTTSSPATTANRPISTASSTLPAKTPSAQTSMAANPSPAAAETTNSFRDDSKNN